MSFIRHRRATSPNKFECRNVYLKLSVAALYTNVLTTSQYGTVDLITTISTVAGPISSIENQTLYYTKKIAETENWNLQDIYSDEGKSGTSLRKRDAFKRMRRDAKDQKIISLEKDEREC